MLVHRAGPRWHDRFTKIDHADLLLQKELLFRPWVQVDMLAILRSICRGGSNKNLRGHPVKKRVCAPCRIGGSTSGTETQAGP